MDNKEKKEAVADAMKIFRECEEVNDMPSDIAAYAHSLSLLAILNIQKYSIQEIDEFLDALKNTNRASYERIHSK